MEDYSKYFSFPIGEDQKKAFDALWNFIDSNEHNVFILNGYAGTGKTSLVGGFIKYLLKNNPIIAENIDGKGKNIPKYEINLLASTGRAAKILSDKSPIKATTIHSRLYKPKFIEEDTEVITFGLFPLKAMFPNTRIYIIDEASMVGDIENPTTSAAKFGEGNLLKDLFDFDSEGKFIFVGDPCQLPPVNQQNSPALDAERLQKKYGKQVQATSLSKIHRQQGSNNDILLAATRIRQMWQNFQPVVTFNPQWGAQEQFTKMPLKTYKRITMLPTEMNLLLNYVNLIRTKGYDYTTMICHSNKDCNTTAAIVRQMLHGNCRHLIEGDLLLVTKNNYLVDLVNGDLVTIKKVHAETREVKNIRIKSRLMGEKSVSISFVKVDVLPLHKRNLIDTENEEENLTNDGCYSLFLIENTLLQGKLSLDPEENSALMKDFITRMDKRGIKAPRKNKPTPQDDIFFDALLKDPYMNALQATYGYALTCHKAQGGEWDEVFVNLSKSVYRMRGKNQLQWVYTSITRAKEQLHFINNWLIC
ncbi:MAG: AAA family ATPase [Prevotellaceae bacterium]|jgi:ATP-dependent exoDNAse (exonuclease V) alpha subunit|nr:AAA family ATPase [Prevotellaceae bacterium]